MFCTVSQQIVPLNIFPRICLKICSGGYSERSGLRVFPQDLLMPCEVVRNWANLGMNMLQIFSPLQYLYTQIFSLPDLVSTFSLTNYLVTSDCFHWNLGNIICLLFIWNLKHHMSWRPGDHLILQANPSWAQRTPLGTKGTPKISREYLLGPRGLP